MTERSDSEPGFCLGLNRSYPTMHGVSALTESFTQKMNPFTENVSYATRDNLVQLKHEPLLKHGTGSAGMTVYLERCSPQVRESRERRYPHCCP